MSDSDDKLLARAIRYISIRDRSEKEIVDYLGKKIDGRWKSKVRKEDEEGRKDTIGEVVDRLREMGLVDDNEFARKWVGYRHRNGKGPVRIAMELYKKGIERTAVKKFLMEIDDEGWVEKATELLVKRMKQWQGLDYWKQKEKAIRFLTYRGFPLVTVRSAIDQVLKER